MDMLTTSVVMPLSAEQANVFQVPPVASDGQGMSFAKSFGEVAAVGENAEATPGRSIVSGKVAPVARDGDASPVLTDRLTNVSAGNELKGMSAPAKTPLAKSGDAIATERSEKLENVPQPLTVADGSTAAENVLPQSGGMDVSGRATPPIIEKPIEPVGEAVETKVDSAMLGPASKVAQAPLMVDEDRSAVQQKQTGAVIAGPEKTTKKELKDKGHSSVAAADSKSLSVPVEGLATPVTMAVPSGAVALPAATQTINTAAKDDSIASAVSGQGIGMAGVKGSQGRQLGADRGVTEKSASGVPKDGAATATKADDGAARTKKDETDSPQTAASVGSANGLIEGKIQSFGGATVASAAVHGVVAATGNVAADGIAKARADTSSVTMTARQDGADTGTTGVGDGHRMLEATSTTLEVGLANGTQGWLKIRAEMTDGGVVNASLSATTSAGQEMLHRELPSLTAYLHEEQIGLGSVVLQTTAAAGSREFAGGMGSDAGREQMPQRGGQEGESRQDTGRTTFPDGGDAYAQGGLSGIAEMTTNAVYAGGSWLSVRA